jgi:UDP-glucose 4-epimerase
MKIILTGGAGFIGSHIQDAYLAMGHEVLVIDNLITGNLRNLSRKSAFYQMDIASPEVKNIFESFKPDIVNHHAAQMDVRKSVADPVYDAQVNVIGMINLLEAARQVGVKKFIFASSGGAIYGEQDYFPADEAHPTRPASPYGLTKWVGEEYLKLYERLYSISHVVLRYANVYGPRQNPHGEAGVVAIFSKRLLKGQVPVINGDGTQTRDYVYVGDIIEANCMALRGEASGIYNIGTGIETDVNTLASILGKHAGSDRLEHGPPKSGEQKRSAISYQSAEKSLGWRPTVPLEEGLRKTFGWFRENADRV